MNWPSGEVSGVKSLDVSDGPRSGTSTNSLGGDKACFSSIWNCLEIDKTDGRHEEVVIRSWFSRRIKDLSIDHYFKHNPAIINAN